MPHAMSLYPCSTVFSVASQPQMRARTKAAAKQRSSSVGFGRSRKEPLWRCVEGCGACCKLDKGPSFVTPEEVFSDPLDIELYRSLTGPDGWCINFNKGTRTCSIYNDRPYFCRVEPDVFQSLYGVNKKKFNKEACSFCRDTIKDIYGPHSKELENFNRSTSSSGFS
ncbi:uncharacterized protein LOC132161976 [Corylus avellana]|uniref:uncharacterized protein LOC132161976 n=1 Tax=Corylus avellana TaxID=13451 RepID=UPI00286A2549|nr:uncharacterized protein LOC132161976 [Corylus avellana]XP_059428191.1 uncharacterized protein LOC132161976 [Corylus avellana]